ncbi:hypothetical protein ACQR1I_21140 [Bradyrhizobium sp. HKCCYLS2038]|uniref:hypothetical protein n=1 Tax=unclassified Bradyrhizobium TaxID=2631580 RepID=UPI003EC06D88
MASFIRKARFVIGIGAALLAASAATSPVRATSVELATKLTATKPSAGRHGRWPKPMHASSAVPRYYGRPLDYAPAYAPGPFVLFTPFYE